MRTETDENYLKEIYSLELEHGQVSTSMLADRFGCSPASVTGMLKKFANLKWVVYEPYQGVKLTTVGREIALEIIRHHRLIETYLAQALNLPWDRVHDEAEKLEHVLSEYLEERIDELLGHPTFDPHGSPIPTRDGLVTTDAGRLHLADLPVGSMVEILEINDHDPHLLVYLGERNLRPGAELKVIEVEPIDGLITVRSSGKDYVLGRKVARQIAVRKLAGKAA
jgi:DtxR family transcriptional regulator, Mn-dependent transcriptional regulator